MPVFRDFPLTLVLSPVPPPTAEEDEEEEERGGL